MKRADSSCLLLAAVIAMLAYAPSLRDGFVFDDVAQVREMAPPESLGGWLATAGEPWWPRERGKGLWRPVTRLAIAAQRAFAEAIGGEPDFAGGSGPISPPAWPFHTFSLLLHVVASLLTFALARALGLGGPFALLAAALTAAHPLRSEAVHQIVGQGELLAAIFMQAGLVAYLRMRARGRPPAAIAAAQVVWFALALGAKEHAVLYPLYVLLAQWAAAGRPAGGGDPAGWRAAWWTALGCGAATVVYLALRYAVVGSLAEDTGAIPYFENPLASMPWVRRLPAIAAIFGRFAFNFVFPWVVGERPMLSPDYSHQSFDFARGWASGWAMLGLGVAIGLAALTAFGARKRRGGAALAAAILLSYGFTANLIFPTGVVAAERLLTTPMIAAALGVAALVQCLARRIRSGAGGGEDTVEASLARPARLLGALIAICWLSCAWAYAPAWRDDLGHAAWTVRAFPASIRGHHNLAQARYGRGEYELGLAAARRAVELWPQAAKSWDLAGLNAARLGRFDEAEAAYRRTMELDATLELVHEHMARLYLSQGRDAEAVPYLERAAGVAASADWARGELARIRR